jgi:hypothetical protein
MLHARIVQRSDQCFGHPPQAKAATAIIWPSATRPSSEAAALG